MKSMGIVRRIDELGRLVLPIEVRKILSIEPKDPLGIFIDGDMVILKKYEPNCIFCGNSDSVKSIKGKNVCINCINNMKEYTSESEDKK